MRKHVLTLVAACGLSPVAAHAQGLGLAARAGTLGLGAEAAIGVTDRIVLRGGFGVNPFDPTSTFDGKDVELSIPTWYNAGVDLYLNGAMRVGGGVLIKREDPSLRAEFDTPQDIGGTTFTPEEIGAVTGVIDSADELPFLILGFGKHTVPGVALFIDLGLAFLGDSDVTLDASGGTLSDDPATQAALDQEAQEFEDDLPTYLQFWPILSLGLRVGIN
jgi:hypothetical protein